MTLARKLSTHTQSFSRGKCFSHPPNTNFLFLTLNYFDDSCKLTLSFLCHLHSNITIIQSKRGFFSQWEKEYFPYMNVPLYKLRDD